jgi:hypothetical protein
MNVPDGLWYGALIISEIVFVPFRIGYDIVDRSNKTYNKYKPDKRSTGYTS